MLDTKALAAATAVIVREHVEAATAPLVARIAVLEEAKAAAPDYQALIAAEIAKIQFPVAPEPIAPDMDAIAETIERAVSEQVKALPAPKDGQSVTLDDVRPLIEKGIAKAVEALPPAKDGVGVAGAVIDRNDNLYLTLTDGSVRDLGRVAGKDADMDAIFAAIDEKFAAIPKPRDGKDGFSLEDFEAKVLEDGRTIRFAMTAGDTQHAYQLSFPVVIDRGVYREGQKYEQGDAVTWAGSIWIAQKETDTKPDSGEGWRLAVKRGRDGKDKV